MTDTPETPAEEPQDLPVGGGVSQRVEPVHDIQGGRAVPDKIPQTQRAVVCTRSIRQDRVEGLADTAVPAERAFEASFQPFNLPLRSDEIVVREAHSLEVSIEVPRPHGRFRTRGGFLTADDFAYLARTPARGLYVGLGFGVAFILWTYFCGPNSTAFPALPRSPTSPPCRAWPPPAGVGPTRRAP